jgi:serine/threonine-protein kinase
MCGAATPQGINPMTGEVRITESTRVAPNDLSRLRRVLGDHYELGRLIGRGGFAEVFLVHDKRLKRDLALKALRPDLILSEGLLARFRREAETVAALRHPHIVPIYDIGEADGVAYIIMPYIQGESLKALLVREGPRPAREASRILLEAAGALGAAHEAGVVHRDIKPENIMLEGKARRAQLMDFGIAKAIDANQASGLTSTGMLVGTPHYMSPEQAAGEIHLDHRSDQYSLAVVGYQMLTGSLPFEGESTRAVLFQQMVGVPKSLRDLVPDIPANLAFALERALAKDPKDRYASMEEFAEAISGPDLWPPQNTTEVTLGGTPRSSGPTPAGAATVETTKVLPAPTRARRSWLPVTAITLGVVTIATVLWSRRPGAEPPAAVPSDTPAPASAAPAPGPRTDSVVAVAATPAPAPAPAASSAVPPPPAPAGTRPSRPTATTPASTTGGPTSSGAATCAAAVKASDWAQAATVCRAESDQGNAASARALAGMYQRGSGVKQSDSAAAFHYRHAVSLGDAQAAYRLGLLYLSGTGVIQNDVEATHLLKQASEGNVSEAWPVLAERYEQGLGTRRNDQEAAYWYKRAAEKGLAAAQYNLGDMYSRGRGVQKSEADAVTWFSRAAEQGHPAAMYQLGMMYIRGKGLPKDEAVGLQWLEKAASAGNPEAEKEAAKRRRP